MGRFAPAHEIERRTEVAQRLGQAEIRAGHNLLSILMEKGSTADRRMGACGLDRKRVEAELLREISDSRKTPLES